MRQFYADIDASKNDFNVMIYHVKNDSENDKFFDKRKIKSILSFSKFFTEAELKYRSTKLKNDDICVNSSAHRSHDTIIKTFHNHIHKS